MTILVENQFCNLGIISRISHILLAKMITLFTGYAAVTFGSLVASGWFIVPFFLAAYLLFTGLIGWTPVAALDNYIKQLYSKRSSDINFNATAH